MSKIKFLYKSQYVVDDIIKKNSTHPVTGGAVYNAIEQTRTNTVLQSGYITNCMATIDKQHNLSFADGKLKLEAGDKVFVPNGINKDTGEFAFTEYELPEAIVGTNNHSDSMTSFMFIDTEKNEWVGNSERTLIYDSDSQTYTNTAIQRVFAQATAPRIETDGVIWWDTTNNVIKRYNITLSDWDVTKYSIPICRVSKNAGAITGIVQDFLTSGYCCYALWVNPGVQFLMSRGRGANGTFQVISLLTDSVIVKILENAEEGYEDQCFYITLSDEIIGPVESLTYNTPEGYFIDADGNSITCAKIGSASATHLTDASTDPLTITSYVAQDCLHLADQNDVEYLIKLIGSSTGDTIDTLLARINALTQALTNKDTELRALIEATANTLKSGMDDSVVHKGGTETVTGVKTFTQDIKGNITGNAQTVQKTKTEVKVLYPCGVEAQSTGRETTYVNTTVKMGPNYVEADEFRGISTATRWADLAEKYLTDEEYPVGTLVRWGGDKELTASLPNQVNAVISEKPAHLMNADAEGQPIALVGRVRVRVLGKVKKFQPIVACHIPGIGEAKDDVEHPIIRALEDNDFIGEKLVLCVVNLSI